MEEEPTVEVFEQEVIEVVEIVENETSNTTTGQETTITNTTTEQEATITNITTTEQKTTITNITTEQETTTTTEEEVDFVSSLRGKKKKKKRADEGKGEKEEKKNSEEQDYTYMELLQRLYGLLNANKPAFSTKTREIKSLPPPIVERLGTKRVLWKNFPFYCTQLRRNSDHLKDFILSEFGCDGSIDGQGRLIVVGRYDAKKFELLLKKYIVEYVKCGGCHGFDTSLEKDPKTRLTFVRCDSCNCSRPAKPIVKGFKATTRADRKKEKG